MAALILAALPVELVGAHAAAGWLLIASVAVYVAIGLAQRWEQTLGRRERRAAAAAPPAPAPEVQDEPAPEPVPRVA